MHIALTAFHDLGTRSPRCHLFDRPAHPIAAPPSLPSAGASGAFPADLVSSIGRRIDRRAAISSIGRRIPSPRRHHFDRPAHLIATSQSIISAGASIAVPPSNISASASIAVPLFHIWPAHLIAHRPFNIPAGASNCPLPITPFIFRLAHSIAAISYCMPRCPLPFFFWQAHSLASPLVQSLAGALAVDC